MYENYVYGGVYLHSSMDRFEEEQAVLDGAKKINLHSSMDRFEALAAHRFISRHPIYIPVWIDLKESRN